MTEVTSEAGLRAIVPEPPARAWTKEVDRLDGDYAAFVAASPFCVLATADADGRCDASPRGGPPGFAALLEPRRLVLPDYKGNRRQDSHRNILANPFVGIVFFVPGVKETLRVNGSARLTTDADVLARLATGGAPPALAIDVAIETAFVHCGKASHRSGLWGEDPPQPAVSLAAARARQSGETVEEVEARWAAGFTPEQLW
jgi:PPOX class probable FMN-dependent enzyme